MSHKSGLTIEKGPTNGPTSRLINGYGWGHSGTIYTIFVENPLIFDTDGVNGGFRPIS